MIKIVPTRYPPFDFELAPHRHGDYERATDGPKNLKRRYNIAGTVIHRLYATALYAPQHLRSCDAVKVSLNRQAINHAPAYNGEGLIDRAAESMIYNHYGRDAYWQHLREGAVV
jgi:hypothetical protein